MMPRTILKKLTLILMFVTMAKLMSNLFTRVKKMLRMLTTNI